MGKRWDNMVLMPEGERFRTRNGFHGAVPMENGAPPSSYAIAAVINGEDGGIPRMFGVTFLRAVFIAPGLWLGSRVWGSEQLKKDLSSWALAGFSLAASSTISLGLLGFYWMKTTLAKTETETETPSV